MAVAPVSDASALQLPPADDPQAVVDVTSGLSQVNITEHSHTESTPGFVLHFSDCQVFYLQLPKYKDNKVRR